MAKIRNPFPTIITTWGYGGNHVVWRVPDTRRTDAVHVDVGRRTVVSRSENSKVQL
ncbi:hypothetical protein [Hallella bergensis]|uniref:hypothetical protein n=1 Tax=Hallella bergensis TaxID=242750 RepID=UPI0012EA014C|nr:hypothetical protein [Hallella bergensis]